MATKKVLTETGLSRLVGLINSKFAEKTEVPKKTSDITNDSGFITAASPELTGTPTAPTAASGTATTQIATTAFVQNAVGNATSVVINDDTTMPASVSDEGLWFQLTGDTSITNGENIGY